VVGVTLTGIYAGIIVPMHEELRDLQASVNTVSASNAQNIEKLGDFMMSQLKEKLNKDEHGEFRLREDKQVDGLEAQINAIRSEVT
jgi:hypothetical protein